MTQEEKARRYNEVVNKLKGFMAQGVDPLITKNDVQDFFPELKESEGERIRKMLIEQMKRWHECAIENNVVQDIKDSADAIAWLEKQGKNNMGISEATKQKLEDNLHKALGKETPETWNKFLDEQKPAWSKEDEDILNTIINHFKVDIECTDEDDVIRWLKSLRPQWKPNEEMLEALYRAIPKNVMEISEDEMLLDKLYQGLKYGRVLSEK